MGIEENAATFEDMNAGLSSYQYCTQEDTMLTVSVEIRASGIGNRNGVSSDYGALRGSLLAPPMVTVWSPILLNC